MPYAINLFDLTVQNNIFLHVLLVADGLISTETIIISRRIDDVGVFAPMR